MRKRLLIAALAACACLGAAQGALADGHSAKGEKVFKKCKACHSLEAGTNKIGPSLHGLLGRTAGTVDGFKYSAAMKESGVVWEQETLDEFLIKPKAFVPGTKMTFIGLKKEQDRLDVIAYLREATQ